MFYDGIDFFHQVFAVQQEQISPHIFVKFGNAGQILVAAGAESNMLAGGRALDVCARYNVGQLRGVTDDPVVVFGRCDNDIQKSELHQKGAEL